MTDKVGYFTKNADEFIITDMYPKRPLINFLWNEEIMSKLDQFCFGQTVAGIKEIRREFAGNERLVYIKDKKDGSFYSPNRNYKRENFDEFCCHVGIGYQNNVSEYKGIRTSYCCTCPSKDKVELIRITIENTSEEEKDLQVFTYNAVNIAITEHIGYNRAWLDKKCNALVFDHDGFDLPCNYKYVFVATDSKFESFETTPVLFRGVYNSFENPAGVINGKLTNDEGRTDFDYGAAYEFDCKLKPNEKKIINLVVGTSENGDEVAPLVEKYINAFDKVMAEKKEEFDSYNKVLSIDSIDEPLNRLTNIWIKRQIGLGKTWGRGAGKGVRDILQDVTAFVSFDNDLAKMRILDTLAHQYISGNAIRMFEPDFTHPYMDIASWIPSTVVAYLKETNDFAILDEVVGYLDSEIKENILSHTLRATEFLLNSLGKHGLVLWGGGDWNDSLNNCGMKWIGESVWLSIATVNSVNETVELLERIEYDKKYIESLKERRKILVDNIIKHGYKDGYFIYGYNDEGEIVGSKTCDEGKIYLNPQTWAIISGIVKGKDADALAQIMDEKLKCSFGYVQCSPSYTKGRQSLGRTSYFCPGVFENGSVYNHGVTFKIVSDCIRGDGDDAYNTLKLISYENNKDSGVEPYAVTNMYYGPECKARKGFSQFSWITGSAGWLYRGITEYIFGIKPYYDRLKIKPCFPKEWDKVRAKRTFNKCKYDIEYIRSDKDEIIFDDKKVDGNLLPVSEAGTQHKVVVYYR